MPEGKMFVGVDVSKQQLEVAVRPNGEFWSESKRSSGCASVGQAPERDAQYADRDRGHRRLSKPLGGGIAVLRENPGKVGLVSHWIRRAFDNGQRAIRIDDDLMQHDSLGGIPSDDSATGIGSFTICRGRTIATRHTGSHYSGENQGSGNF